MSKKNYLPYILRTILIFTTLASLAVGPAAAFEGSASPAGKKSLPVVAGAVPAPISGLKPTISLSTNHGAVGDPLNISGVVPSASYTSVRVTWVISDTTYSAAIVNATPDLTYNTTLNVPYTAFNGPSQVCAALTGLDTAAFACAPFTFDLPAPGSVSGQLPTSPSALGVPQAPISASFNLLDRAGNVLYTTPVGSNGSFTISNVTPGIYNYDITGQTNLFTSNGTVVVKPGALVTASLTKITANIDPVTGQFCSNSGASMGHVKASTSDPTFNNNTTYEQSFDKALLHNFGFQHTDYDFGIYLQGVPLTLYLTSHPQGAGVDSVEYDIVNPDSSITHLGSSTDSSHDYNLPLDVATLQSGKSKLVVAPVVGNQRQCPLIDIIKVMPDPMKDSIMQMGASTTWDNAHNRYSFQGTLINVGGLLPLEFPSPPPNLPLIGKAENKLSAGVHLEGDISLNGLIHIRILNAQALAEIFSQTLYSGTKDLSFPGMDRSVFNLNNPSASSLAFGPVALWKDSFNTTLYKGVIASFWGIINVNAGISVGVDGSVTLSGTIYPFQPGVDATLTPGVAPNFTVSIWVDILLGVAAVGADAKTSVGLGIPLRLDTQNPELVWVDTPCFTIGVTLSAWARVDILFWSHTWNIGNFDVINYSDPNGCTAVAHAVKKLDSQAILLPPKVMAAPAIAASPNGQGLSVYVEDTTPAVITPTVQLMARFWNINTKSWSTPAALTDGSHMIQDPVAAFAGPNHTPIVAWTETAISIAEDQATVATNDLDTILQHQEIFYTTWDASTGWAAPTQLTNDMLPDGRASLAGDVSGATLAWVKNTGGSTQTNLKMRIAVSDWDPASQAFGPVTLLNGNGNNDAMNVQPSVARLFILGGVARIAAIAWTVDKDGNPGTNADRSLVVARESSPNGWSNAIYDHNSALPAGAESPSLSFDPQTGLLHMAFLVRGQDPGGTDTGIGNQELLWVGSANIDDFWSAHAFMDGQQMVHAERPRIQISPSGEELLLFRRFGAPGTTALLGQLALAQMPAPGKSFSPPRYITDNVRQHWQESFSINPSTGGLLVMDVSRGTETSPTPLNLPERPLKSANSGATITYPTTNLGNKEDMVESLVISSTAELALDTDLALSAMHASAGTVVTASATLHNLGLATAISTADNPIQVCFFTGNYPTGTQVGCDKLPADDSLAFNTVQSLSFAYKAGSGQQPIYAQVFSNGFNGSPANDVAVGALGSLPAPSLISVGPDELFDNALGVSWIPANAEGIAGYRILRAGKPGGPYELVGETSSAYLPDLLLQRKENYCYVVQAYDVSGVVSPISNEICASLPAFMMYMPVLER